MAQSQWVQLRAIWPSGIWMWRAVNVFFGFYWELQNQNVLYSPLGILIEDKLGVFYKAKETN